MSGSGNLEFSDQQMTGELRLDASTLTGLTDGFDVKLGVELDVAGTPDSPEIDLRLEGEDLIFNDHRGDDIQITVQGTADPDTPDLAVTMSGTLDGQPLAGKTALVTERGLRYLKDLSINNGSNNIQGNLRFDDQFVPQGSIDINLPQLAPLAALSLQEMSGSLYGTAEFSVPSSEPEMELSLQSDALKFQDNALAGVDVAIKVSDYLAEPQPRGAIIIDRVSSGSTIVSGLNVDFKGSGDWTEFDVQTTINTIPVNAAGRIRPSVTTDIQISKAAAEVQSLKVQLAQTANIQIADGVVSLQDILLQVGKGRIDISGKVADTLDVSAQISALDAGLANQFAADLGATGTLSGQVTVNGTPASPAVNFQTRLQSFSVSQIKDAGISALDITANGSFANNSVNYNSSITGPAGMNITGGGEVGLGKSVNLQLAYDGDIPFSVLAKQLANQGILLEGRAKMTMKITGTSDKPVLDGSITSSGARFVHAESGLAVNNMAMNIVLAGETVRIAKVNGELSTGGRVSANGQVSIAANSGFPAKIKVEVKDGVYIDHKTVSSNFDADIDVSGSIIRDPLISGTVNLKRTTVTIPERLPPSIAKLDITHKNATGEVSRQVEELETPQSSSAGGLRLNLNIRAL